MRQSRTFEGTIQKTALMIGELRMQNGSDIEFFVNNKPLLTNAADLSGGEIKSLAGIPPDYGLYLMTGSATRPIANDEIIRIGQREHFRAIPVATMG